MVKNDAAHIAVERRDFRGVHHCAPFKLLRADW